MELEDAPLVPSAVKEAPYPTCWFRNRIVVRHILQQGGLAMLCGGGSLFQVLL
jgi:hypothetical protein